MVALTAASAGVDELAAGSWAWPDRGAVSAAVKKSTKNATRARRWQLKSIQGSDDTA
jgi:hypothetical protein